MSESKIESIKPLAVEIYSFSYKRPPLQELFPSEAGRHGGGFVFDCRCLPNPGRQQEYKPLSGLDQDVADFLNHSSEVRIFRELVSELVSATVKNYLARNFERLVVGFGCTGGQHRSVFLAEELSRYLLATFSSRLTTKIVHSNSTNWNK